MAESKDNFNTQNFQTTDEELVTSNLHQDSEYQEKTLNVLHNIPVTLSVVVGKKKISVQELLKLQKNSIVALDKQVGDKVDVYVNDVLFARGELVLRDKENLGIAISQIVKISQSTPYQ